MLRSTFIHVPGIGRESERLLWKQGCLDWKTYLDQPGEFRVGSAARETLLRELERSEQALLDRNHQYFATKLGQLEAWRAWWDFKDACAYLDIETDGGRSASGVTVIGIWDGREFHAYVQRENLENFRDDFSRYALIVSFFGTGFDVPVLQKRFKGVPFDQLHIDLCHNLKKLGYRGGLKKIEKEFEIIRDPRIAGMNGYDAVLLWKRYLRGDQEALELLIEYNAADCINLETLAVKSLEKMRALTLPEPVAPEESPQMKLF